MMIVRIILDASGAHPLFTAVVTSPANEEFRTCNRFAAFRDLNKAITATAPNIIKSPFPPTHRSSSLGIKLSQTHLEARRFMLEKVSQCRNACYTIKYCSGVKMY